MALGFVVGSGLGIRQRSGFGLRFGGSSRCFPGLRSVSHLFETRIVCCHCCYQCCYSYHRYLCHHWDSSCEGRVDAFALSWRTPRRVLRMISKGETRVHQRIDIAGMDMYLRYSTMLFVGSKTCDDY